MSALQHTWDGDLDTLYGPEEGPRALWTLDALAAHLGQPDVDYGDGSYKWNLHPQIWEGAVYLEANGEASYTSCQGGAL